VFRTFDLGGDKILPILDRPVEREENPALGWHALAWIAPTCFGTICGRLLAPGGGLTVMHPMVAEGAELDRAREIFGLELERMQKKGMTLIPEEVRVSDHDRGAFACRSIRGNRWTRRFRLNRAQRFGLVLLREPPDQFPLGKPARYACTGVSGAIAFDSGPVRSRWCAGSCMRGHSRESP
jgi:hypothetical protein